MIHTINRYVGWRVIEFGAGVGNLALILSDLTSDSQGWHFLQDVRSFS